MYQPTDKMTGVIGRIAGKIRADEDVPKSESVNFILEVDFSECTWQDFLHFACADRKIAWATSARKSIGRITAGQLIKCKASSPGITPPKTADELLCEEAKRKGITVEELLQQKLAAMMKDAVK